MKYSGPLLKTKINKFKKEEIDSILNEINKINIFESDKKIIQFNSENNNNISKKESSSTKWYITGRNTSGELGVNHKNNIISPELWNPPVSFISIATGRFHSLGLASDGSVWSWGSNSNGELGNGTNDSSLTPKKINSLLNITNNYKLLL